jgi:hypothetical protein
MFLYDCGQISTPERHEFILLSDVLGFSALVDMINTKGGATEGSNLGPFYLDDAPRKALGANLADDREGVTILVHGKVTDSLHNPLPAPWSTHGRPTARAPTPSRSRNRDRTRWTCAACSRPTITAATGTPPSCPSPTPSPMTARWAIFCARATGTRGGPRTCITSCAIPACPRSRPRSSSRTWNTSTTTRCSACATRLSPRSARPRPPPTWGFDREEAGRGGRIRLRPRARGLILRGAPRGQTGGIRGGAGQGAGDPRMPSTPRIPR